MEFNWIISAMDCKVQSGELTNVVETIHWRYAATQTISTSGSADTTYSEDIYGATAVGTPTPENFTSYSELTKEQVVGWLEGMLDIENMQETLTTILQLKINPTNVTLPAPF
jgi:hypothetical protein